MTGFTTLPINTRVRCTQKEFRIFGVEGRYLGVYDERLDLHSIVWDTHKNWTDFHTRDQFEVI